MAATFFTQLAIDDAAAVAADNIVGVFSLLFIEDVCATIGTYFHSLVCVVIIGNVGLNSIMVFGGKSFLGITLNSVVQM